MEWIPPMEPILTDQIISDNNWIHQIKWDGVRGLIYFDQGKIELFTKNKRERSSYYPEILEIKDRLETKQAILDGEMIVLDETGKPSFEKILTRERVSDHAKLEYYSRKYPIQYIIFDILAVNGKKLTMEPLYKRQELLKQYIQQGDQIAVTTNFQNGDQLLGWMKEKGWEGMVSKKMDSLYFPGKHHQDWYKTKIHKKMLTVLGGIKWKNGLPNSLLLGIYHKEGLHYIGKASIGLKQKDLLLLKEVSKLMRSNDNPFRELIKEKEVTWLQPALTCWVQFMEWSSDLVLRHPKILGFSKLKPEKADGKEWMV